MKKPLSFFAGLASRKSPDVWNFAFPANRPLDGGTPSRQKKVIDPS